LMANRGETEIPKTPKPRVVCFLIAKLAKLMHQKS
jgi:hypothetical protein